MRHGYWVFSYNDGEIHEGPYVEDKRHGKWIKRDADGNTIEERWENGILVVTSPYTVQPASNSPPP